MRRVDLAGIHIEANHGAPVLLLREHDAPHRLLPLFVGGTEAAAIALAVSGQIPARPMTHDLMAALVANLGGVIESVEITELRDEAFIAQLAMSGPVGPQVLDTRPSDAIALAVRLGTPIFVTEQVLDAAGVVLGEDDETSTQPSLAIEPGSTLDEASIDEQITAFRAMLEGLDPIDFLAEVVDVSDGVEAGDEREAAGSMDAADAAQAADPEAQVDSERPASSGESGRACPADPDLP